MKKPLFLTLVLCMISSFTFSQQLTPVPFISGNWDFGESDFSIENYMGRESIKLTNGGISVTGVEFLDGTIEVDINFPEARFFPAVFFRLLDAGNYENFYVRPHQAGNPDATQYTPVFNSVSGWQLYHGEGYSQAIGLEPDTWHRIKINVLGDQADIYFDDMDHPFLKITDLKRDPRAGKIGVSSGMPVHFANFRYSHTKPVLAKRETENTEVPPGLITSWNISGIVRDDIFKDKPAVDASELAWAKHKTEDSGTINLARFVKRSEVMNTVIAKLDITAEEVMRKQILFGYSDFISIYVNGKQIYSGRNDFMSRDYRYLGTVGFFDAVYLPLNQGENEVLFAVSENFGGWGLKAFIPDQEGIKIK